ncbi:hypothetical protein GGI35DRAFT_444857 [Trichoderma velutinum]
MAPYEILHGRNLIKSVQEIPVLLPPPGVPYNGEDSPSDADMGKGDPDTISYINLKTNQIPPGHEDRIKEVEDMIDLTHKWLDTHAGIQTKIQKDKGTLPTDMSDASRLKRSDYRIKVLDTILTEGRCPWLDYSSDAGAHHVIDIDKSKFHIEIFKDLLAGITTVSGITDALETSLKAISNIILQIPNEIQQRSVWSFFNVFTWDDVTQDVKGSIRIVNYSITGEMVEYTVKKSTVDHVNMSFDFFQDDYTFVDSLWADSEDGVKQFLEDTGDKKIRDPLEGGEITP